VALLATWAITRHSRARADSLSQYSRAVTALRAIALDAHPESRGASPKPEAGSDARPVVRVLDEVMPARRLHDRRIRASRRASRLDPELVARRPVIAQLPSMPPSPAALGGNPGPPAG
jgi:hypothetical protein